MHELEAAIVRLHVARPPRHRQRRRQRRDPVFVRKEGEQYFIRRHPVGKRPPIQRHAGVADEAPPVAAIIDDARIALEIAFDAELARQGTGQEFLMRKVFAGRQIASLKRELHALHAVP